MSVWQRFVQWLGLGEEAPRGPAASAEELQDLEPGQVVGEYVIERKLGEGGFGAVYRAVHPVIGKAAAVKVLHPQYSTNPEMISRFVSEARAVNQIRHRHIIDIFSFGSLEDGRHYYVMELLEGVTLDAYLEHAGKLELREALPILHAVAKALEAAHGAGIAHRDLKPENIFLSVDDDGTVFPKLLDFGVAKLLTESGPGPMHKTHTGTPIGTPRYMSPEQCQGRKVDHRTDIYSFGIIAHRMLTGTLPFDAKTALELMLMHVGTPPPKLSEHGVDPVMDEPVARMLAKEPENRPPSLSEAFSDLLVAAKSIGVEEEALRISISPHMRAAIEEARAKSRVDRATPGGVQTPARAVPVSTKSSVSVKSGRILVFGALVFATAGILALYVMTRPATSEPASIAATTSAASAPATPSSATPASAPSSASAVRPPASVAWTFDTKPEAAEVFLGDARLGVAPGPFLVPRSEEEQLVTLKATGFEDEEVILDAKVDRVVSVQMKKRSARPPTTRPDVPKDLEYPF